MKITVAIITFNEEEMIVDSLKSADWADEIVVVDSGSSDKTLELARGFKVEIYSLKTQDFASLRDYALSKAKGEWIFYLDADERVTKELKEEIKSVLRSPSFFAYKVRRKNYYFGKSWPYIEKIPRLFKKEVLKGWFGVLHESPKINSEVGQLKNYLLHYTHRNISSMVEKTNKWSNIEADLRFKAKHPKMTWWRFFRIMLTTFWEYFITQRGFRAGTVGFIESIYQSFSSFITYAKLWEKQNDEDRHI